jgi:hypothetical protein
MNPSKEDKRTLDDHDDLDEGLVPGALQTDQDIEEGDEQEKCEEEKNLPPAMPPGA